MLHVVIFYTEEGLEGVKFLVGLLFVEVEEVVVHDDADAREKLGVYAVFFEEVIDVGAMTPQFACEPDDALGVFLELFFEYVAYVHGVGESVVCFCILKRREFL